MSRYIFIVLAVLPLWLSAQMAPLSFEGREQATVGVYVAPIGGKPVVASGASRLLVPASTTKCITAAACVLGLPEDFRFETRVYATGRIHAGKVEGDIVIVGAGDPTLESGHFPDNCGFVSDFYAALQRHGASGVTGSLVLDSSGFPAMGYGAGWMVEDIGCDYGAGLYAINYRDNKMSVVVDATGSARPSAPVEVIDMLGVGKRDVSSYPMPEIGALMLYGSRPASGVSVSAVVSNPAPWQTLAAEIETVCRFDNEPADGDTREMELLMAHHSPRRDEILRSLMRRSDNLYAEGMLRALLPDSCSMRTASRAVAVERRLLASAGIDASGQKILDGSGLSRNALVTPEFMGRMLDVMSRYDAYPALFPTAGREGTVKRLLKGTRLEGRLALKSGSMGGVLCYAGYKLGGDGRPTHVVVIMVNNFLCKPSEIRKAVEHYLLKIF